MDGALALAQPAPLSTGQRGLDLRDERQGDLLRGLRPDVEPGGAVKSFELLSGQGEPLLPQIFEQ